MRKGATIQKHLPAGKALRDDLFLSVTYRAAFRRKAEPAEGPEGLGLEWESAVRESEGTHERDDRIAE